MGFSGGAGGATMVGARWRLMYLATTIPQAEHSDASGTSFLQLGQITQRACEQT
jgi:hypothetical protein